MVGETRGDWREMCSSDRPDLNSETSVAARPACVSGGRERGGGGVKGTDIDG